MPIPAPDEQYKPENVSELRGNWLDDVRLGYEQRGIAEPDIGVGSDTYIRGEANARSDWALYAQVTIARRDSSELTATGDALDDQREALALPIVAPAGAAGTVKPKVQNAALATFFDGTEFRLDNNKIGIVAGTQTNIAHLQPVQVRMTDTGIDTNAEPGARIRWVSPPLYVDVEGMVGDDGLEGGTGEETDEEKRNRILTRRQSVPGAGNNAQLIEIAEGASAGVQKAFSYAALGGPTATKVALLGAISTADDQPREFSREVPLAIVQLVQSQIDAQVSGGDTVVVQSVANELVDVAVELELQSTDLGWVNATPWPMLVDDDAGRVRVTAVSSDLVFTVSAETDSEPDPGVSQISWWRESSQEFVTSLIVSYTGTPGAWVLTMAAPFAGVAVGNLISAAAKNAEAYAATWVEQMGELGPGENTNLTTILQADRGYRFPRTSKSTLGKFQASLSTSQVAELITAHDEIIDAEYTYRSKTTPTIPATVNDAPNVLRTRRFAIYPSRP